MKIFDNKKGQGLSMTVIVVAALALLVLVVLAVIFIGRMGKTASQVDQCKGQCINADEVGEQCSGTYQKVTRDPCLDGNGKQIEDQKCCLSVV